MGFWREEHKFYCEFYNNKRKIRITIYQSGLFKTSNLTDNKFTLDISKANNTQNLWK